MAGGEMVGGQVVKTGSSGVKVQGTIPVTTKTPSKTYTSPPQTGQAYSTDKSSINAGGIGGLFGAQKDYLIFNPKMVNTYNPTAETQQNIKDQISNIENQAIPQAEKVTIETAQEQEAREKQLALIEMLTAQAEGRAPSAAQAQLQLATNRNLQQTLGAASNYRGGSAVAGLRQGLLQNAQSSQDAAAQSAVIRQQETSAARAELASQLNAMRGFDQDIAKAQAGLDSQIAIANMGTEAERQAQKESLIAQYVQFGYNVDQAAMIADIQQRQWAAEFAAKQEATKQGLDFQGSAQGVQFAGALAQGIGSALSSDERIKKNISDGDKYIEQFLNLLSAKKYEYKDEKYGSGERLGVMAQDLEKSKMGKTAVVDIDDNGTKGIDYGKSLGVILAGLANINGRLRKVES